MKSSGFSFTQPKIPGINSIDKMPFDDFYNMGLDKVALPSFPPKSLREIIALVDNNKSHKISVLEWLDIVENYQQWQCLSDDEQYNACRAVWQAICVDLTLGDIAFFKAGLAVDGHSSNMVKMLIETMSIVRDIPNLNKLSKQRLDWLLALKQQDFNTLALMCYQSNVIPYAMIRQLRLPKSNRYEKKLSPYIIHQVNEEKITEKDQIWLLSNFDALVTTQECIVFCEELINTFNKASIPKLISQLIQEKCLPTQNETYWYNLQEKTKDILKKRFTISSYYELTAISRILSHENTELDLGFEDHQRRQIHSRTMFWSNYSSRFNRVRALLPNKIYRYVETKFKGLSSQIECFDQDGAQEQSEVFIFELSNIIVVEFLRGELSETRFFKNTEWNAKRLFDDKRLSSAAIREMSQMEVHDHLSTWQYFCEKLLRQKLQVKPNDNLPYFKGLPPAVNQYDAKIGLPKPAHNFLSERALKLEKWVELFWSAEFKTSKYGHQSGLQLKSNLYLSKALIAKQLDNYEEYELFIKKAANQGNPEAMWQLGKSMLLNRKSDAKIRKYGEEWIGKAASFGHVEAVELATRFKLAFIPHKVSSSITYNDENDIKTKNIEQEKAANEGDLDAMYQLGRRLLSRNCNLLSDRLVGERWIAKAAILGHEDAIKLATKFKINCLKIS